MTDEPTEIAAEEEASKPNEADDAGSNEPPTNGGESPGVAKKKASAVARPYPRRTLEDALRVPNAIKENNGGQPWTPKEVASSVGMGMSASFFYLTSAARDFHLTEGTRDAVAISITELGRRAVYPGSDEERAHALLEAFFSIDIFAKVVSHYGGSKLPDEPYRTNTLTTTFGLDPSIVDEFVGLFEKNARFVGIGTDWNGPADSGSQKPKSVEPGSGGEQTVQVGTPSKNGDTGLRCFIAMPFGERDDDRPIGFFKEVLESLLIPAITDAGFEAFTARRQGSDVIQPRS